MAMGEKVIKKRVISKFRCSPRSLGPDKQTRPLCWCLSSFSGAVSLGDRERISLGELFVYFHSWKWRSFYCCAFLLLNKHFLVKIVEFSSSIYLLLLHSRLATERGVVFLSAHKRSHIRIYENVIKVSQFRFSLILETHFHFIIPDNILQHNSHTYLFQHLQETTYE